MSQTALFDISPVRCPQIARPTVLIVEDEPIIAFDLATSLREKGFAVLGPATTPGEALALLESEVCHAAVVDVLLGHTSAQPVASDLQRRKIPFVFVTGFSDADLLRQFPECDRVFSKPVDMEALNASLRKLIVKSATVSQVNDAHASQDNVID